MFTFLPGYILIAMDLLINDRDDVAMAWILVEHVL